MDKVCRNIYHFVGDSVILKGLLKKQVFDFIIGKTWWGPVPSSLYIYDVPAALWILGKKNHSN